MLRSSQLQVLAQFFVNLLDCIARRRISRPVVPANTASIVLVCNHPCYYVAFRVQYTFVAIRQVFERSTNSRSINRNRYGFVPNGSQFAPQLDVGMDFSKEYQVAKNQHMYASKQNEPVHHTDDALPKKFALGITRQCHTNARDLTLRDDDLFYCEGYALFTESSFPVIRAWVTDGSGVAIDNTWPRPGVAYAGVPFKSSFVNETALKYREIVSLLDDFQNGHPLRNELGERPDEWLKVRGNGLKLIFPSGTK